MHLCLCFCLLFLPYLFLGPCPLSPPPPALSSMLYSLPVHSVNRPHQPDRRYISHISNRSLCVSLYLVGDQQPSLCVIWWAGGNFWTFPLSFFIPSSCPAVREYQQLLLLLLLYSQQTVLSFVTVTAPGDTWYRFLLRSYLRSNLLVLCLISGR